jgi:hypothetical protein
MKKLFAFALVAAVMIILTGCATHLTISNTNFKIPPPDATIKYPITAGVFVPDNTYNYTTDDSLGMGVSFTLLLGQMVSKAATEAFVPIFDKVNVSTKEKRGLTGVDLIIVPIIEGFNFRSVDRGAYLELFAQTKVRFRIDGPKGVVWEKVIVVPEVSGRTVEWAARDSVIAVFQEAVKAMASSEVIRKYAGLQEKPVSAAGLSKEELTSIVQTAVTAAADKKGSKPASVQTEVSKPAFTPSERVFGDNDVAIVIGIEGYQNLPKSDYSFDDAMLVKDYLRALGLKERNIEFITDEKATKASIEKSLEAWLKNKSKHDSRVFVYYSGHGAPDPSTGEAYIVPYDGDPNYLPVTGYPLKRLYERLGKLDAKEIVVVLDSCFSGSGGRSVLAKGVRPLVMVPETASLPSNVAVLTATQGSQISTSSPEKGHGIFTYYFLKAIKDGKRNLAEIYEYIKPLIEDEAKMINVQQSPGLNPGVEKVQGRFSLRN